MSETRIFLSYSSANRHLAEQIESQLKIAGFDVWRDQTRLETDWSREIAHALVESDVICLIWSEAAACSKWVKHEWLTASALEKLIVPCLLENAPSLPERLFNTHGVRFDDFTDGIRTLITRIESITSFTREYDYTRLPSNVFLPFNPNPSFVGRHSDLLDLYLKMIGNLNQVGLNQAGLVGLGGTGKTQLAVEFAYRFSYAFEGGIYWIQATNPQKWLEEFINIAKDQLNLQSVNSTQLISSEQWLHALRKYCKQNPQTLFVMDSVPHPNLLNDERVFMRASHVAPSSLGCDLLFTTHKHFELPGILLQEVTTLTREAAYKLLTNRRKPDTSDEEDHAWDICSAVGYLPLAIVLVEGYLYNYQSVSFADYHAELLAEGLDAIDQNEMTPAELATRHQTSVTVTLKNQWEMLTGRKTKSLLKLASLFPEGTLIPQARLSLLSGIPSKTSKIGRPLEKALNTLHQLCLVERSDKNSSIGIHPLVRDFAKRQVRNNELNRFKTEAVNKLYKAYQEPVRLFNEYKDRGINEVIDDIGSAIGWCGPKVSSLPNLESLALLLDRERHHLKISSEQERLGPVSFLQQLHYRAFSMGLDDWATCYFSAKQVRGGPVLRGIAISEYEDPSLMRTLRGHLDSVEAVSLSGNGKRALSACIDGTLVLWDVNTGGVIYVFRMKVDDALPKVCLNADGSIALVSTQEHSLVLLDMNTGETLATIQSDLNEVTALSLSNDGRRALSAHASGVLVLWVLETGRQLRSFEGYPRVQAVADCPGGWEAISRVGVNSLVLWRVETRETISTFSDRPDWALMGASLSSNGEKAIACSAFNTLSVWSTTTGEATRVLRGHSSAVSTVSLSADAKIAISADRETVLLWNLERDQPHRPNISHVRRVDALSLTNDGRSALTGSDDNKFILWDARTGQPTRSFDAFPSMLVSIDSSATRALSASMISGEIVLWDLRNQQTIHRFDTQGSQLTEINLSEDGGIALAYTTQRRLMRWDTGTGKRITDLQHNDWVWPVAFTTDNRYAAVSCYSDPLDAWDKLEIWDLQKELMIREFGFHPRSLSGVRFLGHENRVLVAFNDNKLAVANVETGEIVRDFEGFGQLIHSRGITADGKYAVTISDPDNQVLVMWKKPWEFQGRKFVHPSIILWDLEKGMALVHLLLPRPVTSLGVIGDQIVFGDQAGIVSFLKIIEL